MDLIEQILGDDAPTLQRAALTESRHAIYGGYIPIQQRMAACEIPLDETAAGLCYPCETLATLATLNAQGRHVCSTHARLLWHCGGCGGFLPEGRSGYCSLVCTRAAHATATWLGQRLGARYTTPERPA